MISTPGLIVAVALATYAVVCLVAAPYLLTRGSWRVHYPRLCLTLWYAAFLTGVGAGVGSGAIGVWYGWQIGVDGQILADSFGFSAEPWVGRTVQIAGGVIGWSTLAIGGGLAGLVATRAATLVSSQRRLRADVDRVVARSGYRREVVAGTPVTYVASRQPIACGLTGRSRGAVIISAELDLALSRRELRAVIEHERAHLRGAHQLLSRLALLNQACLPSARAARELRRATALLIELIADDAAARRCGGADLAAALTKIGNADGDPTIGLRARRIEQRLALAA
ncbi:M56 family metallopeptidase [Microlunatus soli]|uniref:Peptidase family M48 n=1 Tax=Microlunatus soli TaxID=630515 RepID=A0A1H1V5F6_9ACTN|nr:M56 family metallopeptidase [Microlunatus soli]SDS79850.1 Peptidase family M48 [Microlunatus soli]